MSDQEPANFADEEGRSEQLDYADEYDDENRPSRPGKHQRDYHAMWVR